MATNAPARAPSLLLAASLHRSGSTLLQRYVSSMTDLFVWGESSHLIESMVRAWEEWPSRWRHEREYRQVVADPTTMERKYTPNLSPPRDRLIGAFAEAFCHIYHPTPDGFVRWGWKSVRYGRREIEFVRALFPEIRILLLVRDPYHVTRSIRRKGWIEKRGYFSDAYGVAREWVERTSYFLELRTEPGVHFIQYERLRDDLPALDAFVGAVDDPAKQDEIFGKTLGAAPARAAYDLTGEDIEAVAEVAGDLAESLGYHPPEAGGR